MPSYYMKLAEEAEPELTGDKQAQWLNRLEDEHDNLRSALRWAAQASGMRNGEFGIRNKDEPAPELAAQYIPHSEEIGLRIAVAISQFWETRGFFSEGREHLEGLLSLLPPLRSSSEFPVPSAELTPAELNTQTWRAKAHSAAGMLAYRQGEYAAARVALEQGLALGREVGDKLIMARSFNRLGNVAYSQGDYPSARSLYEQSLAMRTELGNKQAMALSFSNLGVVAYSQGDYPTARSLHEQSLTLRREVGDKRGVTSSLLNLGNVVYIQGDYPTAASLYDQSLALFQELGDKSGIAITLLNLGSLAYLQGDYPTAASLYDQSLALFQELGDKSGVATTINSLGSLACIQGEYQTAASLYEQGLAQFREMEDKGGIAVSLMGLAAIRIGAAGERQGPDGIAAAQTGTRLLGAAEALLESIGAVLEAVDRTLYTQGIAAARLQLGDEPFEKVRQEGRAMSTEAAIEYALHLQPIVYEPALTRDHEVRVERHRRVEELHIAVNQAKKAQQVEAITGTEYFIELQAKARALIVARQERGAANGSILLNLRNPQKCAP